VLAELELAEGERMIVRQALERLVRERAGTGTARLANPINIGFGTK
jgi:hypothetical protein